MEGDFKLSNMDYEFRVVFEKVSVSSQKVIKRDTLKIYDINQPQSILDLGLRHEEQISLLSKVQNALLGLFIVTEKFWSLRLRLRLA